MRSGVVDTWWRLVTVSMFAHACASTSVSCISIYFGAFNLESSDTYVTQVMWCYGQGMILTNMLCLCVGLHPAGIPCHRKVVDKFESITRDVSFILLSFQFPSILSPLSPSLSSTHSNASSLLSPSLLYTFSSTFPLLSL